MSGASFTNNRAFLGPGGGAYFATDATLVAGSLISNTASAAEGYGGGAFFIGTATVTDTLFSRNRSGFGTYGYGGAAFFNGETRLASATVISNTAGTSGGGVYLAQGAHATLENSVLAANWALTPGGAAEIALAGTGATLTGTIR